MAAQGLSVQVTPPEPPRNKQEPTPNVPLAPEDQNKALLQQYGPKLIAAVNAQREKWNWKRRGIVLKVLQNKSMLKGDHHVGAYPGTYNQFDAMQELSRFNGADDKNADLSVERKPHNFYRVVEKAYVSSIGAAIPRSRWKPANADVEEDRETAKVSSRVEEIIERANKGPRMLKQELMEMFTSGCYFKFTRYVVDPDRTGTHKETIVKMTKGEVLPPRYVCFNCGTTTPQSELMGRQAITCPVCGTPFGPENFFEDHIAEIPVAEQKADVPNGMVLQSVYGPMHIDADPDSPDLMNTPLLNVAEEVSIGWLRMTFDDHWGEFQEAQSAGNVSEQLERLYRDILTTPQGYATSFSFSSQNKPTYNRTWIQPMLFAEMEGVDKSQAKELMKAFPSGCMLAWVGEIALQIRAAKLTDEWTWNGTEQVGFGLYPAPAGDAAVPVQQRLNDCMDKIDDYMDRLAVGILLANTEVVDEKALNGKAMLPGILNPVKFRKGMAMSDIQHAIFQVKAQIDSLIFQYVAMLKQDIELLVGTPPQTFGAGTQEGVETMGGQRQQLQTGMQRLNLDWESLCDEHAEAAENAIKCAAKNMTDDWFMAVNDEDSGDVRNDYVYLDQMKGSVHAERDTEQGFPMTASEIRTFWQEVLTNAENQFVAALMDEPQNVEACVRALAIPGMVAPKGAARGKMLRQIAKLIEGKPIQQPDPISGEPLMVPSVQPNKYLDDCATLVKLIPSWADEHWDQLEEKPDAIANLEAFFKMCVLYEHELATELAMTGPPQNAQPTSAEGANQ
jgi:hypothetical protein